MENQLKFLFWLVLDVVVIIDGYSVLSSQVVMLQLLKVLPFLRKTIIGGGKKISENSIQFPKALPLKLPVRKGSVCICAQPAPCHKWRMQGAHNVQKISDGLMHRHVFLYMTSALLFIKYYTDL